MARYSLFVLKVPLNTKQTNIGDRTRLSDGRKKEIYRDVRFFHGALQLRVRKTYSFNGTLSILIWVSRHQKHRISIHLTASLSLLHVVSQ